MGREVLFGNEATNVLSPVVDLSPETPLVPYHLSTLLPPAGNGPFVSLEKVRKPVRMQIYMECLFHNWPKLLHRERVSTNIKCDIHGQYGLFLFFRKEGAAMPFHLTLRLVAIVCAAHCGW